MLFAFADVDCALQRLERLAHGAERTRVILETDRCVLAAWDGPSGARVLEDQQAVVEGRVDLLPGGLTPDAMRGARGDFALLASTPDGLLMAAGVSDGARPIYVAVESNGAVACTRLAPLLSALYHRPRLAIDGICTAVCIEPRPFPEVTPYEGVLRVPEGQAWLANGGSIRRSRIVRSLEAKELAVAPDELHELFRESLRGAVLRAIDRPRVAIAVSGGLDSSSLMATACELARSGTLTRVPDAFYHAFETPRDDDAPFLRLLAERLGISPIPLVPDGDFRDLMVVDAAPCCYCGTAPWVDLNRRAKQLGADLMLTGVGGDHVLNGNALLLADEARRHPFRAVRRAARLRGAEVSPSAGARIVDYVLRPFVGRLIPTALRRRARTLPHLMQRYPWAGPRLRRHLEAVSAMPLRKLRLRSTPAERYEWLLSSPATAGVTATRAQFEAASDNVQRSPYLDDEFLRFVATIPPLALLEGDYQRGLMRSAMRGRVPEALLRRETKGYYEHGLWVMLRSAGGFAALQDLADVRMLADLGIIEPKPFRAHFEEVRGAPLEVGWVRMWAVLATESFLRRYDAQGAS